LTESSFSNIFSAKMVKICHQKNITGQYWFKFWYRAHNHTKDFCKYLVMDGIIHCFTYLKFFEFTISLHPCKCFVYVWLWHCGDLNRGVHGRAWDHNTWQERNLKGVGVMVLDGIKSPHILLKMCTKCHQNKLVVAQ
jgi:hypothetical protein